MASCASCECSCPSDLQRQEIVEKIDLLTDSLVLLAGLRAEYRLKSLFTPRLRRKWTIAVYYGEDCAYERRMEMVVHSRCQLEKFYLLGMLLSRKYRAQKFGLGTIVFDANDNTCQEFIETQDGS